MIKFTIGGKPVDPNNIKDTLMGAVLKNMKAQISQKVGAIRDPDTGEFPTVVVRGDSIDDLTLYVEGSDKLVALVRERLGLEGKELEGKQTTPAVPKAFVSYTHDNLEIAQKLALALQANGIEVWWDRWCIYPGDSLRQKIDEGLEGCTHFLALLTPESIKKPWVNEEMDAALVLKLKGKCKFLPIRHNLPIAALPPLMSGMHSPSILTDVDIAQLINDIYGIAKKPPLGAPPAAVEGAKGANSGFSAAANAIARLFVEQTKYGLFADPQFTVAELAENIGLSVEDTKDALYELSSFVKVGFDRVLVQPTLATEFDRFWKPWNTADDALKLAADIVNDPEFPASPQEIANRYQWEPRRLNPAITYLLERQFIRDYQGVATGKFVMHRVVGNEHIRRFVKSRNPAPVSKK